MKRHLSSVIPAAMIAGLGLVATAGRARADRPRTHADATGEITLYGCTARSSEITIYAAPMQAAAAAVPPGPPNLQASQARVAEDDRHHHDQSCNGDDDDQGDDDDDGAGDDALAPQHFRIAELSRTANPHVFTFTIPHLDTRKAWQVGGLVSSATCKHVLLGGLHHGLLGPVGAAPLHLQVVAMRTEIEVQAPRGANLAWVGADLADLQTPGGATRSLRIRTDLPGVTRGELQVSTDRFPIFDSSPNGPSSIIARQPLQLAPQGWTTVANVDLAGLLAPPPPCQNQNANIPCNPPPDRLTAVQRRLIDLGAPIYVRFVPFDGAGHPVRDAIAAGTPATVIIAHHTPSPGVLEMPPPPPGPQIAFAASYTPGQLRWDTYDAHPNASCYSYTEDHWIDATGAPDAFWDNLVVNYGIFPNHTVVAAGRAFCTWSGGSSFFDDLGDAVSGFIDAVGDVVDGLSKLYADLKAKVVELAADAVSDLGIVSCDEGSLCRQALAAGLDYGLAAMGLPPSLPNFDELVDQGVDYLAAEVSEQLGVPPSIIEDTGARDYVKDVIKRAHDQRAIPLAPWLVVDSGFRAPNLMLGVTHDPASPTAAPNHYTLVFTGTTYQTQTVSLPANHLARGDNVQVPVNLIPNLTGIPEYPGITIPCTFGSYEERHHLCSPFAPPIIIPALRDQYFLAHWWSDRYLASPCTTVLGLAKYRTESASGADFYFDDPAGFLALAFHSFEPALITERISFHCP